MTDSTLNRILLHLASASPEQLEAFLPKGPPAAAKNISGGSVYVHINGIGHVLRPRPDSFEFKDGYLTCIPHYTVDGKSAEVVNGELHCKNSENRAIMRFAPHGENLRLAQLEIIPHTDTPQKNSMFVGMSSMVIEFGPDGHRSKVTVTYSDHVRVEIYKPLGHNIASSETTRGRVTTIHAGSKSTRVEQLHPDVRLINGTTYVLRTDEGNVEYRWMPNGVTRDGKTINGYVIAYSNQMTFMYEGKVRSFVSEPDADGFTLRDL